MSQGIIGNPKILEQILIVEEIVNVIHSYFTWRMNHNIYH